MSVSAPSLARDVVHRASPVLTDRTVRITFCARMREDARAVTTAAAPTGDRVADILRGACRVVVRDGAHGLRMAEVAREAGVSKALLHYYFSTRQELLRAAFAFSSDLWDEAVRGAARARAERRQEGRAVPARVRRLGRALQRATRALERGLEQPARRRGAPPARAGALPRLGRAARRAASKRGATTARCRPRSPPDATGWRLAAVADGLDSMLYLGLTRPRGRRGSSCARASSGSSRRDEHRAARRRARAASASGSTTSLAVDDISLDDRQRRVLLAPRPVGLRQDDDAADDRRVRAAGRRPHRDRRRRRHRDAAAQAAGEHGLPELRALPAPHRGEQNVGFGLRFRKLVEGREAGARRRRRSSSCGSAASASASRISSRAVSSSGWRSRARSILSPDVLLLDEPLGALDAKLRRELQIELKSIQREVGITFLYVTHDQEEALTMSDRLAVMAGGRVEQLGTPREVYEHPQTAFVADFLGVSNLMRGVGSTGPAGSTSADVALARRGADDAARASFGSRSDPSASASSRTATSGENRVPVDDRAVRLPRLDDAGVRRASGRRSRAGARRELGGGRRVRRRSGGHRLSARRTRCGSSPTTRR